MARQYRGTRYKKVKAWDSHKQFVSKFTGKPYTATTVGKVHLMWYDKGVKEWKFVCGKRVVTGLWSEKRWDTVADTTIITCLNCQKHAPEVISIFADLIYKEAQIAQEEWDSIPDLEEFQ